MLSALQHYAFCPRQCALIHIEQVWQENAHTTEGRLLHETAHASGGRMRGGMKSVTNLELASAYWGIYGRADVVEFRQEGGTWLPCPVEYKKGRPHPDHDADAVQLCAQALCLEEMLGVSLAEGALYYGSTRRRQRVAFTAALRERTAAVIQAVRALLETGVIPPAREKAACAACSLKDRCLPDVSEDSASRYVRKLCEEEG